MNINVKRLNQNALIPQRGSACAAGYDLYANIEEEVTIEPFCVAKIGTGISIEIVDGYFGAVFARSGLATKQGLRPSNCVGVIDSDYRKWLDEQNNNVSQIRQLKYNPLVSVIIPTYNVSK